MDYRLEGAAAGNGCMTQFDQEMHINRPGTSDVAYVTNTLKAGFNNTWVWSERAGVVRSKAY